MERGLDWYRHADRKARLPHLVKIHSLQSKTAQSSNLSIYDYDQEWNILSTHHLSIRDVSEERILNSILSGKSSRGNQKVLVIEDIHRPLIECLIKILNINPEFFESHLTDATLEIKESPDDTIIAEERAPLRHEESFASGWPTRRLSNDFYSFTWFRPYRLNLKTDRIATLSQGFMEYQNAQGAKYKVNFSGNIARQFCQFQTDGATCASDFALLSGIRGGARFAYQERLTIWRGERSDLKLIIVLVDNRLSSFNQKREVLNIGNLPKPEQVRKDGVTSFRAARPRSAQGTQPLTTMTIEQASLVPSDQETKQAPGPLRQAGLSIDSVVDVDGRVKAPQASKGQSVLAEDIWANWGRARSQASVNDAGHSGTKVLNSEGDAIDLKALSSKSFTEYSQVEPHTTNADLMAGAQIYESANQSSLEQILKYNSAPRAPLSVRSQEDNIQDKSFETTDINTLPSLPLSHTSSTSLSADVTRGSANQVNDALNVLHTTDDKKDSDVSIGHPVVSPVIFSPGPHASRGRIQNVASRGPTQGLTLETALDRDLLRLYTSTGQDLGFWLEDAECRHTVDKALNFGPTIYVHKIIQYDVLDFLQLIHHYLDEITLASDNEVILERNILAWRQMLWLYGKSLRQISSDLPRFSQLLLSSSSSRAPAPKSDPYRQGFSQILSEIEQDNTHLLAEITAVQRRVESASGVLASSISVAEARRGVSEAEGVSRLTELAFIYIPLSFAASFFGMQVKELNPSTTSISAFFAVAILITSSSYGLRLLVRSKGISSWRTGLINRVRQYAGTSEGVPTRTRDFIAYLMDPVTRSFKGDAQRTAVVLLLSSVVPLFPMIAVWSRDGLQKSMKIAITIEYLMFVVLCIGFIIIRRYSTRPRTWTRPLSPTEEG